MSREPIVLKKVFVHNLKGVDLTLQPGQLVVFTGVSGSGKSSLAFDTIYAEGQRRYIESLSHHARRFLGELPKPDAESITGIAPTISIEQKLAGRNPRSTVGTMTGIYDVLRVLYARVAVPHCPVSGEPVAAQSREKIIATLQRLPLEKAIVLAPYARAKKGEFKEDFAELLQKGFTRLRVDGSWIDLGEIERLDPAAAHDVDIVVDRIIGDKSRLAEAASLALELGKGFFSIWNPDTKEEKLFSEHAYSPKSGLSYGPLEPHDFSFNHPLGMCPTCHGLGVTQEFNLEKTIDPEKGISEDCCSIAPSYQTVFFGNVYDNLARLHKFSVKTPWKDLSAEAKQIFLYGVEQKWTRMIFVRNGRRRTEFIRWRGVLHEAKERFNAAKSDLYRKKMGELMIESVCPACQGARIKPYPAAAQIGGKQIAEVTNFTLEDALEFFEELRLSELEMQIAEELLKEIKERLHFLIQVGVQYLSLARTSPTLSGGESQRVRLASQIGVGLIGAIYILDEPSIGLHPVDHHKLINTLLRLKSQGNTVLVVEHDLDTMIAADSIVDVGPGAGFQGGRILAHGNLQDVMDAPDSLTGAYLSGRLKIEVPKKRRKLKEEIEIVGASHHNLQNIDVAIPLGGLICVTGVSGSGKSSLISDILAPALANRLHHAEQPIGRHQTIRGVEEIEKVIAVDQSPIGRTPRSNAATYIKLFDDIRDLFAELPESKLRAFTPGHFSFNVKEGSCSYCGGLGQVRIDMDFLEDAYLECPQCKGQRYDPDVLSVRFKEKNMHDILSMEVEKARELFDAIPTMKRKLDVLQKVGLGYLTLGQPSTTLSGGEAQRIKLAKELVRPSSGKTLYILDEPTTGLHFHDIQRLIAVLHELVEKGHTVLVIEHNMDLVKTADWVIDLGPGAGVHGGLLIGSGTPEAIAKLATPTGRALKSTLASRPISAKKQVSAPATPLKSIVIRHARQNNLKDLTLTIPRDAITVLTGPSGSGKSSLAFETLYAEGQRRYAETLPAYARQAIQQMPKPKVDEIIGLSPAIALEQKTGGLNPRSTVGTITEIYDLLRILFAHLGIAYSPDTGEEIKQISREFVVERALKLPKGEKIQILSPLAPPRKETFEQMAERLNRDGYLRIRLNRITYQLDEKIPYEKHRQNELFLVIDRLVVDPKSKERLFESIAKATALSGGIVVIARENEDLFFNLAFAEESTGKSYPPITPQTFSFNAEAGMCPDCQGLGATYGAHLEDEKSILRRSALEIIQRFFKEKETSAALQMAADTLEKFGVDPLEPLKNLPKEKLSFFLNGANEEQTARSKEGLIVRWIGLHPLLSRLARAARPELRHELLPLLSESPCPACQGSRLNPLARNVRIGSHSLPSLSALSIEDAHAFLSSLPVTKEILREPMAQIRKSLSFLIEIGLHYLSLDRSAPTLSGGELQRLRLSRQLGSGLTSCLYVLDEPTIGLHPYNSDKLLAALRKLRDLGNTLVLVEHDPLIVEKADYLFDFGPKAGREGGRIVASGTIPEILQNPHSLTGAYLSGRKKIPIPKKRRPFHPDITIENASLHNLKNITVSFPKSAITCCTGVSGSGKSTLVRHLLKPAALLALNHKQEPIELLGARFFGLHSFDKVISIDQSPMGQTIRADVSTYTEIQPLIRSHFAALPDARIKGLQPRHFSANHRSGMCRTCWGLGFRKVDLQFLPAVKVVCESCRGYRLNPIALSIETKGKNFGQLLEMSIDEALIWFSPFPRIVKKLETLKQVGLSYLKLNQDIASLSGGEGQRLRLSRELSKPSTGSTLYLIDEPTVGLHSEDIEKLLAIFHRLADKKNTLVIIEHNLDLIANADYVIDLGPEAGIAGGAVIATGTPEQIARNSQSHTGKYLAPFLPSTKNNLM